MITGRSATAQRHPRRWPFYIASAGTVLRRIDDAPTLFVEASQSLFGLDEGSAVCWPLFEKGVDRETLRSTLGGSEKDADAMLELLEASRAIQPLKASRRTFVPAASRTIVLNGAGIRLHFEGHRAAEAMNPIVSALDREAAEIDRHMMVFERPAKVGLAFVGEPVEWEDWDGAAPALRAFLTTIILSDSDRPAIHAATLIRDGATTLLLGEPAAGKSTLAVALSLRGFTLAGDDVAILAPDGSLEPVGFPATLKEGSWPLFGPIGGTIDRLPVFVRSDGKRVRYLPLGDVVGRTAPPVRHVVDLRREAGARAAVAPIGTIGSLAQILAGSWSKDNVLGARDFIALSGTLANARGLTLRYDDLDEAADLLCEVCRGDAVATRQRKQGRADAA